MDKKFKTVDRTLKKLLASSLAFCCMSTTAFAAEQATVITYVGQAVEEYEVTVPANLTPGDATTIDITGAWPAHKELKVTAPETVTLTSEFGGESRTIDVDFAGVKQLGSNTSEISLTADISVGEMPSDILFGTWTGTITYEVSLDQQSFSVGATDSQGQNLNASATVISGDQKTTLLNDLVSSGLISNSNDVNLLLEVTSNEFDGQAETTFDVSSIAEDGDLVAIYHYNEEAGEWEYISTETVVNGKVTASFDSFSPVAFVNETAKDETPEEHVHSYGEWETVKEATCTEAGSRTRICADTSCGDAQTETIPAGHSWRDTSTTFEEPTCTEEGIYRTYCRNCDEYFDDPAPAKGHSYGDWETVEEATCIEAGQKVKKCACGDIQETSEIPAKGHSYGNWTVTKEATCTEAGSKARTCECGDTQTETIPAGHSYYANKCTSCNKILEPGFYDAEGNLIVSWEDSGIVVENGYGPAGSMNYCYNMSATSGYNVINSYSGVKRVVIPTTITTIGTYAFAACDADIIFAIPDSATDIADSAFDTSVNLQHYESANAVQHDFYAAKCVKCGEYQAGGLYDADGNLIVSWNDLGVSVAGFGPAGSMNYCYNMSATHISNLISNYPTATEIVVPTDITELGPYALAGLNGRFMICVPDTVISIGNKAFEGSGACYQYNGTATPEEGCYWY